MKRTIMLAALAVALLAMLTAAVPGGRSRGGVVVLSPRYVTRTVIFKLAPQSTRSMRGTAHRAWDDYFAAADEVVNLHVDSLTCDVIQRRSKSSSFDHVPGSEVDSIAPQRYCGSKALPVDGSIPDNSTGGWVIPEFSLYWLPFEQYIPADAHIVSAKMMCVLSSQYQIAAAGSDTFTFAALTEPGSGMWRRSPLCYPSIFYNMRTASWNNQFQPVGKGATRTYTGYVAAGQDSFPWPLDWDLVTRSIDIGPRSRGYTPTGTIAQDSSVAVDFRRPLQKWVCGEPNLGMVQLLYGGSAYSFRPHNWGVATADSAKVPWFVVTYQENRRHVDPWPGGKECAIAFVTDDARMPYNADVSDIFAEYGASYTMAMTRAQKGSTNYWKSWTQILEMLNEGTEIASHSMRHKLNGLAAWDSSLAEQESLLVDCSTDWIYAGLDSADATRTASDFAAMPNVAKVMAAPNNNWSHRAIAIADSLGYVGMRVGNFGTVGKWQTPADSAAAFADGIAASLYMRCYGLTMPYKMNRFIIPYGPPIRTIGTDGSCLIYGGAGAAAATEAQVRRSLRLAVEDASVRYNELLVVFCHDSIGTVNYPNDGINRNQWRWTLDELLNEETSESVALMNLGDAARFMKRNGTSIAHPAPWGTNDVWESRLGGATGPDRKLWWISNMIGR